MPISFPERLLLVAPSLAGGGAERTAARLASHWAGRGRAVTLVTLDEPTAGDWPLHPGVRRIGLGVTGESANLFAALAANRRRVRALRAAIVESKPHAVVSLVDQTNVLTLLATHRRSTGRSVLPVPVPVVVAERTDPRYHPLGRPWRFARDRTYPRAAAVVVQTEELADWARRRGWNANVVRIPNGVDAPGSEASRMLRSIRDARRVESSSTPHTLLALGRLSAEKGFDTLIRAFGKAVAPGSPPWRLVIGGEGPRRAELERLVDELGLTDRVSLPGRLDPAAALADADLFALTSDYEGFPNALLEAMAAGVCPVCLDTSAAVREIVTDGVDGVLVEPGGDRRATVTRLAAVLADLFADPERRRRSGEAARSVAGRYSMRGFHERWDALLTRGTL